MSGRKDNMKSEELKNILMTFRIADLQSLLTNCGRSRSGRKHELLGRALSLLKTNDSTRVQVKKKILEIHNQRFPSSRQMPPNATMHHNSYQQHQPSYASYNSDKHEDSYSMHRSSSSYKHSSQNALSSSSSQKGSSSSGNNYSTSTSSMPIHLDVKFIDLPFYNVIDVLVKPTSLVQKTVVGYQDTDFLFHLTPYQCQLINSSRAYNSKQAIEYTVQIQLRFCLAEVSCVQEDLYPSRCKLSINGKGLTLPGQPPPNAQNQEPRKPHRPINITHICRLTPTQANQIHVQWMPSDMGQRWTATVHLVKVVQPETLIQQLKAKTERPPAHTLAFIKEKLKQDPDSEIALTSLKVSLCCPIGRTRMTMPCRATNCKHLQCFDGSLYIQMNERKPSWVCPVCDQKAYYDQLFKDGMFMDIMEQSVHCDEIMFFEDGSWRSASEIEESSKPLSQVVQTPARQTNGGTANSSANDESSPPSPININTPPLIKQDDRPFHNTPPPKMPQLDRIPTENSEEPGDKGDDEEVEVICIDDSDDDDVAPPPSRSSHPPPPLTRAPADSNRPPLPFPDPDLQGLDLYNILPYEDRIAAAMHLDQNNYCANLGGSNNSNNSRTSSSASIIDISDE
ncbi:E3 SUMO-protein ligase PIAS2-like isoform X2 [Clytia hemisphaerica]|uniref:E3 SUMO-protein ligase PIAS2-like isoform X2 n=1 Tax=Clytia hemisphaerica TaxID=252671 RepID=UPI0034D6F61E